MRMAVRSRHTTVSECNKTAGYGEAGLLKPTKTKSLHGMGAYCSIPMAMRADFVSRRIVAMFNWLSL